MHEQDIQALRIDFFGKDEEGDRDNGREKAMWSAWTWLVTDLAQSPA
jgi:hypothetical protein